jgi:hypothetical protein
LEAIVAKETQKVTLTVDLHTQKDLERMATRSLIGRLVTEHPDLVLDVEHVEKVIINFQETTTAWKYDHGGPSEIILPEHLPCCLCEDIILLMKRGIEVEVHHVEVLDEV